MKSVNIRWYGGFSVQHAGKEPATVANYLVDLASLSYIIYIGVLKILHE